MAKAKVRVLVADDEPLIRELFLDSVPEGVEVDAVGNGLELLAAHDVGRYHLIVTDYEMPHHDGISAVGKIKARDPSVEVWVMSGNSDQEATKTAALGAGANRYYQKPVLRVLSDFRKFASEYEVE